MGLVLAAAEVPVVTKVPVVTEVPVVAEAPAGAGVSADAVGELADSIADDKLCISDYFTFAIHFQSCLTRVAALLCLRERLKSRRRRRQRCSSGANSWLTENDG